MLSAAIWIEIAIRIMPNIFLNELDTVGDILREIQSVVLRIA